MKSYYPYIKDKLYISPQLQIKIKNYLDKLHTPLVQNIYSSIRHATPQKLIEYIQANRKSHPYYLKFDISKFFVDIKHDILIKQIEYCISKRYSRIGKVGQKYKVY